MRQLSVSSLQLGFELTCSSWIFAVFSVVQRQSPEDCAGERCVTSSQWALGGPGLRCTGRGETGGVLGDV